MLEAISIEKSYGTLKVLKGVDLSVKKGEVVSIVGASGAGKSTLLHMLGTLDTPDKGRITVKGQDVFSQSANELASYRNKHIGFVFQFHNLLPEFTALENVMIPGLLSGRKDSEVKSEAEQLLEELGLKDRIHHKPAEMSGGEQQRTAVARALINSPDLILADEPSGNLDSKNARELHELFFKLREKRGQTFIIVTHNQEFADMADRKLEMRDGIIQA
ncbi:MAG: ABC transporter ATP-binding protein [Cyclobacteriaceae bacterium]|nr:ABC transporter ATP-binding protein [Cyclobacteriaceae bacterium]